MSVVTYKCPNCDGELIFDPQTQQFACPYCQSSFAKQEIGEQNEAVQSESVRPEASDAFEPNAVLYTCPSCGAEITVDDTTAATFCFYCHNPVVLSGRLDGQFLPQKLIPFRISRSEAVTRFLQWGKNKWFTPKYFFSEKQIEKLSGVYFPYWLVNCDVHGSLSANAKQIRTWRSGNTEYIETSHFQLYREGDIHFEDVIKAALKKSDYELVESIQPFSAADLIPFSMPYLSGFQAEKRNIERAELQDEVMNDVQNYSTALLKDSMKDYTAVTPTDQSFSVLQENWDYTLLPVWVLTYRDKNGKIYYYAMNGQNGNVFGNLPISFGKLFAVCGGVFALLSAIFWIVGWFM